MLLMYGRSVIDRQKSIQTKNISRKKIPAAAGIFFGLHDAIHLYPVYQESQSR